MIVHAVEESGGIFDNLLDGRNDHFGPVVAMLDQVVIYQVGGKTCKLGQNLMQHI